MAGLRFTDLQSRPMAFLDFTSLTLDEFQQLVPPFETAFHTHMAVWRMDGKPRTARRLALVPFDVIRPTEPDFWTLSLEKVMILSRGTSFSAEDQHDIDTHALYRLWV